MSDHLADGWTCSAAPPWRQGACAMSTAFPNPVLPQGTPPQLITAIGDAALKHLERHGVAAFEASRDAAIVHEASHAIVGTHEGFKIREISIHSQADPIFGSVWGGRCLGPSGWTSGPDTSAADDLRHARMIIA